MEPRDLRIYPLHSSHPVRRSLHALLLGRDDSIVENPPKAHFPGFFAGAAICRQEIPANDITSGRQIAAPNVCCLRIVDNIPSG